MITLIPTLIFALIALTIGMPTGLITYLVMSREKKEITI